MQTKKLGIRLKVILALGRMPFFYIPPRKRGFDMAQTITGLDFKIREMAFRIRELRQIEGLTTAEMATKTDISAVVRPSI